MEHMMHYIESNRAEPYTIGCHAASRPDERNSSRFSLPLLVPMGEVGEDDGVGLYGNTGLVPPSSPNRGSRQSNEWKHLGARPGDRPSMPRAPVEPSRPEVAGIDNAFLARHSQDRDSLNCSSSLPGASYVAKARAQIEDRVWQAARASTGASDEHWCTCGGEVGYWSGIS